MTPHTTPRVEIDNRIERLKSHLAEMKIDAALLVQNSDLFYFAGTIQQAHLFVPLDGEPILMVRKDFDRARAESPIERIVPITSPQKLPELLRQNGHPLPHRLGMELDVIPANLYLAYREIFAAATIGDISSAIRSVRAVKSDYEIGLITTAAGYSDRVAESVLDLLKEGRPVTRVFATHLQNTGAGFVS